MTRGVALRFVALVLAAVGLVACASDPAPSPGAEPIDTDTVVVEPTDEPAGSGDTTEPAANDGGEPDEEHEEVERLPALDEDSAM